MTDDHTNPTDEQLLRLLQSPRAAGFLRAASPWMGPQETAAYLGIALGTLRNWTSARYIPFSRRGSILKMPFDSDQHLFEVKWDGVRALAAVEDGAWRLWGRTHSDYAARYPELAVLRGLPAGTVVDGEVVQFRDGRADLAALLGRHHLRQPDRIPHA